MILLAVHRHSKTTGDTTACSHNTRDTKYNTNTNTNTKYTCDTGQTTACSHNTRDTTARSRNTRDSAAPSAKATLLDGLSSKRSYPPPPILSRAEDLWQGRQFYPGSVRSTYLGREESLSLEVVVGSGVRFGPPGFEVVTAQDDLPEGKARELVASRKALEARGAVADHVPSALLAVFLYCPQDREANHARTH